MDCDDFYDLIRKEFGDTDFLYHYAPTKTILNKILPSGKLKFNSLKKMHDPLEQFLLVGSFITTNDNEIDIWRKNQEILNELRSNTCIASFTIDAKPTKVNQETYRGYSKIRMWIQYAKKLEGGCLVFSKSRLISQLKAQVKSPQRILSGKVIYNDNVIQKTLKVFGTQLISIKDTRDYFYSNRKALLFTKNHDFRDEYEYRIGIYGKPATQQFIEYKDALLGCIFDFNHANPYKHEINNITLEKNIPFVLLSWIQGSANIMHSRIL